MKITRTYDLKPTEGMCIRAPNGRPALQIITYKDIELKVEEAQNYVQLKIFFEEPFINSSKEENS